MGAVPDQGLSHVHQWAKDLSRDVMMSQLLHRREDSPTENKMTLKAIIQIKKKKTLIISQGAILLWSWQALRIMNI